MHEKNEIMAGGGGGGCTYISVVNSHYITSDSAHQSLSLVFKILSF